ncbi:MAG: tetratricopeptide repeat protein [Candidatus Paracaedibacteraceae bacterium]|nr:tetratricopeptide repeat protein [Candidatus Paracaedibacteraceae bacterium]
MAEKFDEFIEEVEKDIRQEKFETLWNKYGKIISTVLIVALGSSSGWVLWRNHSEKQLNLISQKFTKAADRVVSGNINEAIGVYESIVNDSAPTYASLASIAKAAALYEKGGEDAKKAVETLTQLTSRHSTDPIMRDYALLTLIRMDIDLLDFDKITEVNKAKLMTHLASLDNLTKNKAPWKLLALELKGFILYELKDYTKASEIYVAIAQTKACPRGLRARAEIMSQVVLKKIQNN